MRSWIYLDIMRTIFTNGRMNPVKIVSNFSVDFRQAFETAFGSVTKKANQSPASILFMVGHKRGTESPGQATPALALKSSRLTAHNLPKPPWAIIIELIS